MPNLSENIVIVRIYVICLISILNISSQIICKRNYPRQQQDSMPMCYCIEKIIDTTELVFHDFQDERRICNKQKSI